MPFGNGIGSNGSVIPVFKADKFKMVTRILFLSLLLIAFVLLFYPMFLDLAVFFATPGQEHDFIFIIPLFSVYFLWVQRGKIKGLNTNKSDEFSIKIGFIMLLFGLFLYTLGKYTYILSLQGIAFIITVAASVLFLGGREVFKVTAVPIFFLVYMLPIPSPAYHIISGQLKYLVADMTAKALSLLNIPVFVEGSHLHLPKTSFLVHDICSGIRTIISLFAIATGFAYLALTSWRRIIMFVALSIPIGIIVNILRVLIIGVLAYLYDEKVAMAFHSHSYGFVTPVGIVSIFFLGNIFRWLERKNT